MHSAHRTVRPLDPVVAQALLRAVPLHLLPQRASLQGLEVQEVGFDEWLRAGGAPAESVLALN